MKNKIALAIVSLLILSFTSSYANAASFDLKVELFQDVSTCPTITSDSPPLNKNDMPVFIQNFYEFPDTFALSLELPNGWHGFVEPNFIVNTNEKKQIDSIWITVPDTTPGTYPVKIKAKSGQTGDEIVKTFNVEVLSCHHVELSAVESYKEVCREKYDDSRLQIRIDNQGMNQETFTLSVYQDGNKINWVAGSPSITIPGGEDRVVDFAFDRPDDILGEQKFTIVARSTTSYAEGSTDVSLIFKDCYSYTAKIDPQEHTVCSGDVAEYKIEITNTGEADSYTITASEGVEIDETVSLEKNEKKTITATTSNDETGRHVFDIVIDPANEEGTKTLTGAITVDECRGVAIVVTPGSTSLCSGDKALFKVMVKNTGGAPESVSLSTDYGVLETQVMELGAKEVKMIDLVIDTTEFTGEKIVTITAVSGIIEDHAKVKVLAEDCYSSEVTVTPEDLTMCACESTDVDVEIKNTGMVNDIYTITIGEKTYEVEVAAGESKTESINMIVPCDATEDYVEVIQIASEYGSMDKQINVAIQPSEECYAVELTNGEYVEVQAKKSFAIPVTVKNIGKRADSYKLTLVGPEWSYIEPLSAMLEPNEEDMVFVYISPPFNVVMGEYTATVKAMSEMTDATHTIKINVTEGVAGDIPEETEPEEPTTNETSNNETNTTNETIEQPSENVTMGGDDSDVVLNASINQSEGEDSTTARVIQLERSTRLIIVGIIVVAVILILIVRFMTLIK